MHIFSPSFIDWVFLRKRSCSKDISYFTNEDRKFENIDTRKSLGKTLCS